MTKLTPKQEFAVARVRTAHDAYMDAKRNLKERIEAAYAKELTTLNLARSSTANEALALGAPKSRVANALRNQNWAQLQALVDLTAAQYVTGAAQVRWFADGAQDWRVGDWTQYGAVVVFEADTYVLWYSEAQGFTATHVGPEGHLVPAQAYGGQDNTPETVKDAVLTMVASTTKLPDIEYEEWEALRAADPTPGDLATALKS